jgi:hypothetical protein
MSQKNPNADISCNVSSCTHHCMDKDFCSLRSIRVEACRQGSTGKPEDESMCGSYAVK